MLSAPRISLLSIPLVKLHVCNIVTLGIWSTLQKQRCWNNYKLNLFFGYWTIIYFQLSDLFEFYNNSSLLITDVLIILQFEHDLQFDQDCL